MNQHRRSLLFGGAAFVDPVGGGVLAHPTFDATPGSGGKNWYYTSGTTRWMVSGNGHAVLSGPETYNENGSGLAQPVTLIAGNRYIVKITGTLANTDAGFHADGLRFITNDSGGNIISTVYFTATTATTQYRSFTAPAGVTGVILLGGGWNCDLTYVQIFPAATAPYALRIDTGRGELTTAQPFGAISGDWSITLRMRRTDASTSATYIIGRSDKFDTIFNYITREAEMYVSGASIGNFRLGTVTLALDDFTYHEYKWDYVDSTKTLTSYVDGVAAKSLTTGAPIVLYPADNLVNLNQNRNNNPLFVDSYQLKAGGVLLIDLAFDEGIGNSVANAGTLGGNMALEAVGTTIWEVSDPTKRYLAYQQRVQNDGGVIYSLAAVIAAYDKAIAWQLDPAVTHWSSPQFGYKLDGSGNVIKRYCLFGRDATPQGGTGSPGWKLVASTAGKPPQMDVYGAFQVSGIVYASFQLTVATVVAMTSYDRPAYFFAPIVEHTLTFQSGTFLLGYEANYEAGGQPNGLTQLTAHADGRPPLLQLTTASVVVDPAAAIQTSSWENGVKRQIGDSFANYNTGSWTNGENTYIGARGNNGGAYYWAGYINDVFFTNKVLLYSAVVWLENRRYAYPADTPAGGSIVESNDARWAENGAPKGTITYTDQPFVRYGEPGNANRWQLGVYGKRIVLNHSNFAPSKGHVLIDGVEVLAYTVSGAGRVDELVFTTLDFHSVTFEQHPDEGYIARPRITVYNT